MRYSEISRDLSTDNLRYSEVGLCVFQPHSLLIFLLNTHTHTAEQKTRNGLCGLCRTDICDSFARTVPLPATAVGITAADTAAVEAAQFQWQCTHHGLFASGQKPAGTAGGARTGATARQQDVEY